VEICPVDTDLGDSDTSASKRKRSIRNGKRLMPRCESPEMGIFGYVSFEYESGPNPARGLLRKRKRERMSAVVRISTYSILTWGRIAVADNQSSEQKSSLVIRVPLSGNSFASIYYSSSDGTQMSEREWWHLRQVVELASKMFVKQEERAQAASAGA
jgi:hypothetical protein